eukprot:1196693-Rhodomonas_salina.2
MTYVHPYCSHAVSGYHFTTVRTLPQHLYNSFSSVDRSGKEYPGTPFLYYTQQHEQKIPVWKTRIIICTKSRLMLHTMIGNSGSLLFPPFHDFTPVSSSSPVCQPVDPMRKKLR